MEPSKACFDLIKSSESCRLKAYLDPVGIPTIGWGHTSPSIHLGDSITIEQAISYLNSDVNTIVVEIQPLITQPLTQGQFDAIIDFTYNVGISRFKQSTLLKLINEGNMVGAADQFTRWNKAGGKVLKGLVRRREAERELFLT